MAEEAVLAALDALDGVLDANERRANQMRKRIVAIRSQRAAGCHYADIVRAEDRPLIVELLTESALAFDVVGSELRRTEARALHDEGLTMEDIARLFGVTRQRVSALLRDPRTVQHA